MYSNTRTSGSFARVRNNNNATKPYLTPHLITLYKYSYHLVIKYDLNPIGWSIHNTMMRLIVFHLASNLPLIVSANAYEHKSRFR